jgi:hypothetical protein
MASKPPPPPEIAFDEKWDRLIDTSLRRVVYGTLAGGAVALLLLRGPLTRTASSESSRAGEGGGLVEADSAGCTMPCV